MTMTHDGEESRGEGGDEVLASASTHDGVVGARDRGAVVGRHHQTHLKELGGVPWQSADTHRDPQVYCCA